MKVHFRYFEIQNFVARKSGRAHEVVAAGLAPNSPSTSISLLYYTPS